MLARRRRDLVSGRRRIEDEGEEEGSAAAELPEDSQSDASVISDNDDDGDADDDLSETEGTDPPVTAMETAKSNGVTNLANGQGCIHGSEMELKQSKNLDFATMTDTEAMMNGLIIPQKTETEPAIDFDNMAEAVSSQPQPAGFAQTNSAPLAKVRETPQQRRRRENEQYKQKRESDPAFIPDRGNFFMHDRRSAPSVQNGPRPFGRGIAQGRRSIVGPFSPTTRRMHAEEPASTAAWTHDLHESVAEATPRQEPQHALASDIRSPATSNVSKFTSKAVHSYSLGRSLSTTTPVGHTQIRAMLPGMKEPIIFSNIPVHKHVRLPDHRPPLRRDRPVRVSLPGLDVKYMFPSQERSFIFIPRAMRPNQQVTGRGRGRFGSYGAVSSRRTSAYGESVYSPSVAMSRKSSMARDGIVSPANSIPSRPPMISTEAGKPIVRLPSGTQQPTPVHVIARPLWAMGASNSTVNLPQGHVYAASQMLPYVENSSAIPMHQPRPQKAVSVADIEPPQQQQEQPFHHQVPTYFSDQPPTLSSAQDNAVFYPHPHPRHFSFPNQRLSGTPLGSIPERAIHAQPFQPIPYQYPLQPMYTQVYPDQLYYPPSGGPAPPYSAGLAQAPIAASTFIPVTQQGPYLMFAAPPTQDQLPAPPPNQSTPAPTGQSETVAHESNGMVYYYNASQLYSPPEGYQLVSYPLPGLATMITPTPDGYYYPQVPSGQVYYQT